jgi:hypothetical protein
LRNIAEEALGNSQEYAYGLLLDEVSGDLREIAHTVPLDVAEPQALTKAHRSEAATERGDWRVDYRLATGVGRVC